MVSPRWEPRIRIASFSSCGAERRPPFVGDRASAERAGLVARDVSASGLVPNFEKLKKLRDRGAFARLSRGWQMTQGTVSWFHD
jgi:hypothetical protein